MGRDTDVREPGEYKLQVVADHRVMGTKGRITVKAVVGVMLNDKGVIKISKEAQETNDIGDSVSLLHS